jgi:uncharacterized protein YdeI (YjbR/CyaY-like superfamily)
MSDSEFNQKIISRETLYFENREQWRSWLAENCRKSKGVWLIFHRKSAQGGLIYPDARDEALCFGWIDSTVRNIDEKRIKQYFSPRRANGVWSKFNRNKIEELLEKNLMTPFGFDVIEKAKTSGFYYILDSVENLVIPIELAEIFTVNRKAEDKYNSLSRSQKKRILYSLLLLKTAAARRRKVESIARNLSEC